MLTLREGEKNWPKPAGREKQRHGPPAHAGAGTRKLRLATVQTLTTHAVLPTRGSAALHTI